MIAQKPFYTSKKFKVGFAVFLTILVFLFAFRRELVQVGYFFYSLLQVYLGTPGSQILFNSETLRDSIVLIFSLCGFGIIFFISLFLVAFYVLPVITREEHNRVFQRLIDYITFSHGPALFVREGKLIARKGEVEHKGRGVVLVDGNSAVILDNLTKKTIKTNRQGGTKQITSDFAGEAGIIFTEYGESIRDVVDLRTQIRVNRDVKTFTKDGIEVSCNVSSVFTLGQPADVLVVGYANEIAESNIRVLNCSDITKVEDGNSYRVLVIEDFIDELDEIDKSEIHHFIQTNPSPDSVPPSNIEQELRGSPPYQFNRQNLFKAIYAKARNVNQQTEVDWTELPPNAATDIFRSLINQKNYNDLYNPEEKSSYPISELKSKFRLQVRNLGVLSYEFIVRRDGNAFNKGDVLYENFVQRYPVQELRQPKVLRSRGIKVLAASFSDLKPSNPLVRQRMMENLLAYWQAEAIEKLSTHEIEAINLRNSMEIQVQRDIVNKLSQVLNNPGNTQEALAINLMSVLDEATSDPDTRILMPAETLSLLGRMREWISPISPPSLPDSSPKPSPPPVNVPDDSEDSPGQITSGTADPNSLPPTE